MHNHSLVVTLVLMTVAVQGEEQATDIERAGLVKLQSFVGAWRGVGQPQRGSGKGAWTEKCRWIWRFENTAPSLAMEADGSRFLSTGRLRYDPHHDSYALAAELSNGSEARYVGTLQQDKLVLEAVNVGEGEPARITVRQAAGGDRLLILYERRTESGQFSRLAEVGYTRDGSGFGKGTTYVECVVTGGHGTIPVSYQGKTYYVCCSGCRDYFNENPEVVMEEYRSRRDAKTKK